MNRLLKRSVMAVSVLAGGVVLGLALTNGQAAAFDNQYWDDSGSTCDVSDCSNVELRLMTGQTRYVRQSAVHAVAYFTSNSGQLTVYDKNWCPTNDDQEDYLQTGDYYDLNPLPADGSNVTRFDLHWPGYDPSDLPGEAYDVGDAQCNDTIVYNLTNMPQDPKNPDLYYAEIDVTHIDTATGYDGVSNLFYFQITSANAFAIAQKGGSSGYEVTVNQDSEVDNIDIYVRFGSDCTVPAAGSSRELRYYDLDNAPNVSGSAQQNGPITMELIENGVTVMSWTPVDAQNTVSSRSYTFKPYATYNWRILNVYKDNAIQFSTPFDGIWYLRPCTPPPPPAPCPWNPALAVTDPLCVPPPPPDKAYFRVLGGDIVAGASIATDPATPCSGAGAAPHITTAGISTWNRANSDGTYRGAGSEYAAQALNFIQGLVTGQGNNATAPLNQEKGELAFANDNTGSSYSPTGGLFGGRYGEAPCFDYWNNQPASTTTTATTLDVNSLPSGSHRHNGPQLTLSATTLAVSKHVTLYVNGDVNIAGNITNSLGALGSYATRNEIPSLKLVVKGRIFIDRTVTALDGLYVAIPDTGATAVNNTFAAPIPGTISTCSNGFSTYRPTDATVFTQCRIALTVNGSMVGHQVWLLRTFGELDTLVPAETFNFTPEIWMAPSSSSSLGDYTSVQGMPPVL
jgi:hypothetical protein